MKYVLDAIATGQLQATGALQDMGAPYYRVGGLSRSSTSRKTPPVTAFQVVRQLKSRFTRHIGITSPSFGSILLRMRSWENFVFLEGH